MTIVDKDVIDDIKYKLDTLADKQSNFDNIDTLRQLDDGQRSTG